jgi:antitoxin (DNA-binding transcriptional repressor) of toxin-antitoxin stability system
MKEISIRELHRRTGAWVRSTRRYDSILVRDRGRPIEKFAALLDQPVRGTPVDDIVSDHRDR